MSVHCKYVHAIDTTFYCVPIYNVTSTALWLHLCIYSEVKLFQQFCDWRSLFCLKLIATYLLSYFKAKHTLKVRKQIIKYVGQNPEMSC